MKKSKQPPPSPRPSPQSAYFSSAYFANCNRYKQPASWGFFHGVDMLSIIGEAYFSESEVKDLRAASQARRPSTEQPYDGYKTKYAATAKELGAEGMDLVQIASWIDSTPHQLFEWATSHPDFAAALIDALNSSQRYWRFKSEHGA